MPALNLFRLGLLNGVPLEKLVRTFIVYNGDVETARVAPADCVISAGECSFPPDAVKGIVTHVSAELFDGSIHLVVEDLPVDVTLLPNRVLSWLIV
jgi:hypothetical protein